MKGFKDSTKTQYSMGGSCDGYAKGGAVKGAAKISKVMGEFKSGSLHSGSKKGPEVTNPKQAVAIALSEARKAGAKIPVKKYDGGMLESTSSRPTIKGRPMSDEELSTPERILRQSGRADPYEKMPPRMPKGDDFRKEHGLEVTKTTVREIGPRTALDRKLSKAPTAADMAAARRASGKGSYRNIPLIGGALGAVRDAVKDVTGYEKGGLSAMPRGKKGC